MFTRAFNLRKNLISLNYLQQYMIKEPRIQKRAQYMFSEEQYQETPEIKNTKEFPYNSRSNPRSVGSEEEKQEYISSWPEVVESFTNACTDIPKYKEHLTKLLQETVYKHKQDSGILAVTSYKAFAAPEKLHPETVKIANILGWCANMLQSMFIIEDDIIDGSETRFGKPSWFANKHIGMVAVIDATLMENGIYLVLRKYLSGIPCHFPIVEHFHDVATKTAVAVFLDTKMYTITGKPSLKTLTMDIYKRIAHYKAGFLMYVLPVTLGMYLAGNYEADLHRLVRTISCEMGLHMQAQNDMLDCYGNPGVTGKTSTDIRDGTWTWLIVKALERATLAQKQILSEHYGRPEHESEMKVRTLYDELGMLDQFLLFEEQSFNKVCQAIQQLPKEINKEFFRKVAEAEYARIK